MVNNYPELASYNLCYNNRPQIDFDADGNVYAVLWTKPFSNNQYLVSFDVDSRIRFLKCLTDTSDLSVSYGFSYLTVLPEENRIIISGNRNYQKTDTVCYLTYMSFSSDGTALQYNKTWTDSPVTSWLSNVWGWNIIRYNGINYLCSTTLQCMVNYLSLKGEACISQKLLQVLGYCP